MGSVRRHESKGTLFLDFRFAGQRLREYTTLADTPANRKRLQKVLERIETEIAVGSFDYQKTFGKPLPVKSDEVEAEEEQAASAAAAPKPATPPFRQFAEQWYGEAVVSWRRSYAVTQRGALDKYLIPYFADKEVGQITKADVLAFRASLAKVTARKSTNTLSNRRINSVMKPLRQILNEAADRFEFTSAFRNIKPLKMKRSDVMPFSLDEVQRILTTVREDFFGRLKNEMFYPRDWKSTTIEVFIRAVHEYILWYNEKRIKMSLGSLSPIEYRESLGLIN